MLILLFTLLEEEQQDLVKKIYKDYHAFFMNISRNITGSQTMAEDAVSEAYLRIIKNIKKISDLPRHDLRPFCVVIVKNCSMDILRKNERYVYGAEEQLQLESTGQSEPEQEMLNSEEKLAVSKLLSVLSDEEKAFVSLKYAYGMKYKEIAVILDISEETARKRNQRIIDKLRKSYMEDKDGSGF